MKKILVACVVILFMSMIFYNLSHRPSLQRRGDQIQNKKTQSINYKGMQFTVAVADTPVLRTQGLSDTMILPYDGMLFVFDTSSKPSFWMKDMNYPIDIIWLDQYKKVVDITHSLSPSTYPDTVSPQMDSQYVLETKSGFAKQMNIQIDDLLHF